MKRKQELFEKFDLMNKEYRVLLLPKHWSDKEIDADDHGYTDSDEAEIGIKYRDNKRLVSHSWWHEIFHAVARAIGDTKLDGDEGRIDAYAGAFDHIFSTGQGSILDKIDGGKNEV